MFDDRDERAVGLLPVLREARRPYDEELARAEAERREKEEERERLRSDPEALRAHLRSLKEKSRMAEHTGHPVIGALAVTVDREGELEQVEREALLAFGGMLAEPLSLQSAGREPTAEERRALDALVEHHRAAQRRCVEDLGRRFGEGPALRGVRPRIAKGDLLGDRELDRLSGEAEGDCESRGEQRRLRNDYLSWREKEARRLAKVQGFFRRLGHGPQTFLDAIDRRALRLCRRCEEIAFPDPERADGHAKRHVAQRCHYCGAGALAEIEPALEEENEGPWA